MPDTYLSQTAKSLPDHTLATTSPGAKCPPPQAYISHQQPHVVTTLVNEVKLLCTQFQQSGLTSGWWWRDRHFRMLVEESL